MSSDARYKLWPVHLKPKAGELLSSWLARLSIAHGLNLSSFFPEAFEGLKLWQTRQQFSLDVDNIAEEDMLQPLRDKTGTPMESIVATTLSAFEGTIFITRRARPNKTWILPVGTNPMNSAYRSLQYCPACLAEDKEPYFRRNWRLAFIVICPEHRIPLLDKCMSCGTVVSLNKVFNNKDLSLFAFSITSCHKCKEDLGRKADHRKPVLTDDSDELKFQKYLVSVIGNGWAEISLNERVYAALFFEVLHRITEIFSIGPRAGEIRRNAIQHFGIDNFDIRHRTGKGQRIESFDVNARRGLLNLSERLLRNWPHEFINFCRLSSLTGNVLLGKLSPAPFWYWKVVHDHFDCTKHNTSDEEIESALR